MKLLFFEWNAFMQKDIEKILFSHPGLETDCISYEFKNPDEDELFVKLFPAKLLAQKYDAVFSVNFFPLVSDICEKFNIPYISWVYDAPMNVRKVSSIANHVNKIYVFDKGQYKDLKSKGFDTVFHKPLGVNTSKIKEILSEHKDIAPNFLCDISFVGRLYNSDFEYLTGPLPVELQKQLNDLTEEQLNTYGSFFLDKLLTPEYMDRLNFYYSKAGISKPVLKEELLFALSTEVTHRERIRALKLLSDRFPVTLYSFESDSQLHNIIKKDAVNYYTEMPLVFTGSRINLNITLKIIKTGIPLRVFDILGAGGFLLSNWQQELDEYYTDGTDVVMYKSLNELVNKAEFYLSHEDERRNIAVNGHIKTHKLFELDKMLSEILNL